MLALCKSWLCLRIRQVVFSDKLRIMEGLFFYLCWGQALKIPKNRPLSKPSKANNKALALHPNTTALELQRLFAEASLHRYLVRNPNLPYDLLWRLAEEYPRQAFENPAFSLLCLEHPEQLENISSKIALQFATMSETPSLVLRLLARHPSMYVAEAVSRHKNAPPEALLCLAKRGLASLSLAHHQNTTPPVLQSLLLQEVSSVRAAAAKHPAAPQALIARLHRAGFSASLEREPKQLGLLSEDDYVFFTVESEYLAALIARSPFTPEHLLVKLSLHSSPKVRISAAQHPTLPVDGVELLAEDADESVRVALAQNPGVPAALLRRAALDSAPRVRAAVARNRCASQEVLRLLARDLDAEIRDAVLAHPNCPKELAERWMGWGSPADRRFGGR